MVVSLGNSLQQKWQEIKSSMMLERRMSRQEMADCRATSNCGMAALEGEVGAKEDTFHREFGRLHDDA